jgi:hypothetical protein
MAIKVARQASREYLDCRVGVFLNKLDSNDADAQMAFYAAAEDVAVDAGIEEIDIAFIMQLLELILEFIEALKEIFNR